MALLRNNRQTDLLNLDFNPFDSEAAAENFFPGGGRQVLLEQLTELCCYSSDLGVVTGPLGSGKTTLVHWLAQSLDEDFVTVQVQATLFMSAEQLLEAIGRELSLEMAQAITTQQLLEQLDQYAETLRARSRTLQLLVDDAHELGQEALQVLLELQERQADSSRLGEDGVKLILFGEPMLLSSVEQLATATHLHFELEPMAGDEVIDYVAFKLASAGYDGRFPLDVDVMTVIEGRSKGIPGAIDTLVRDELTTSIAGGSTRPELGILERHLVAASVLFGALLLILFFNLGGPDESAEREAIALTADGTDTDDGAGAPKVQIPVNISGSINRQTTPLEADDLIEPGLPDNTPAQPLPTPAVQQAAADRMETPQEPSSVAPAGSGQAEQSPVLQAPDTTGSSLLARPPESYTLQLLGSLSETNVQNFIAGNNGAGALSYFKSRYQDRPWFVVVHGNYPNREAAREAIENLPPALRELNPWARSLSDIQADIRQHQ